MTKRSTLSAWKKCAMVGPAALGLMMASSAFAQANSEEWARVRSSEPIYGQAAAIQRPSCTTQLVQRTVTQAPPYQQQGTNIGGAIVGTILGGVLGNQVGGGSGKAWATAAGAGAGALAGERLIGGNAPSAPLYGQTQTVPVENCVTVTEMQPAPIVGYRVVLDHHGKDFVYQSPVAPRGEYVKIRVQVTPEF